MYTASNYVLVQSLDQALELNRKRSSAIIGGGCWLRLGRKKIGTLIDLSALGLDKIQENEEEISLGAMVTLRQMETSKELEAAFGPARACPQDEGGGPGRYITFDGFRGRVGFISAMTHRFCDRCNRVRLTSSGFLKTCLQYDRGAALKPLLDAGAEDEDILAAIRRAVGDKPAGHHFTGPAGPGDEARNMSQIGG